ncbi:unnamed protein product [Chrysoparadoxa australica]
MDIEHSAIASAGLAASAASSQAGSAGAAAAKMAEEVAEFANNLNHAEDVADGGLATGITGTVLGAISAAGLGFVTIVQARSLTAMRERLSGVPSAPVYQPMVELPTAV